MRCFGYCLLVCLVFCSPLAISNQQADVEIPVGEPLILEVIVDKHSLGELFAIKSETGALIGLSSLFDLLSFAIEVSLAEQKANGWYISADYQFELDLASESVRLNSQTYALPLDSVVIDDDLYVDSKYIEQWFLFNSSLNFSQQTYRLAPQYLLPFQQKLKRQNKLIQTKGKIQPIQLPMRDNAYQRLSVPVLDTQLSYLNSDSNDERYSLSVVGGHDLFAHSSNYYALTDSGGGVQEFRLKLSKRDDKPFKLGLLDVLEYSVGDVQAVSSGFSSTGSVSRGINLTNRPRYQTIETNVTEFSGNIQPGWDVELYRNKILVAKLDSNESGRYEFSNVELIYGQNDFELIFYGPQGQIETETKSFLVENNTLEERDFIFQMALTQNGRQLFDSLYKDYHSNPAWLFSGRYDYGLNDDLSVYLGHQLFLQDTQSNVSNLSLGANAILYEGLLGTIQYQQNDDKVQRLLTSLRTRILSQSINLRYNQTNTQASMLRSYSAALEGAVYDSHYLNIKYLNTTTVNDSSLEKTYQNTNTLAFHTPWFSLSNYYDWRYDTQTDERFNLGSVGIRQRLGNFYYQLAAAYEYDSSLEFTGINASLNWLLSPNLTLDIDYTDNYYTNYWDLKTRVNWLQPNYKLSSSLTVGNDDRWRFLMSSNFSFGYHAKTDIYFLNRSRLTYGGMALVRVFKDNNTNGVFDVGDTPISGVKVSAVQQFRRAETNSEGLAFLKNLAAGKATDIDLDISGLSGEYLVQAKQGSSITPRAAYVEMLDIPLVNASELEGTVLKNGQDYAPYVPLQLKNKAGEVIAETKSEFDGFYLFIDIPPGEYKVEVPASYLQQKNVQVSGRQEVSFDGSGQVLNGIDIVLNSIQSEPGYVPVGPTFSSQTLVKLYWLQIKKRLPSDLGNEQSFVINDSEQQKYRLAYHWYKTAKQAQTYCQRLTQLNLSCQVEALKRQL